MKITTPLDKLAVATYIPNRCFKHLFKTNIQEVDMARKKRDTRNKDPEETRALLIGAARQVFAEHGYGGAKVDEIALRAGANKAMINYHFGGKQGLYRTVFASFIDETRSRLEAALADITDPNLGLRTFIRTMGQALEANPDHARVAIREMISDSALLDEALKFRFLSIIGIVRGIIEKGVEAGVFRPINPFFVHINIMASLVMYTATGNRRAELAAEVAATAPSIPLPQSHSDFVAHLEAMILASLQPHPEAK